MSTPGLVQELRNAGLRVTAARKAVAEVLEQRPAHLSAEDVHSVLRERGVRIDLSSVYRTLDLLSSLGLVRQVSPSERHAHFEIDHEEAVHLTCTACGEVIEARLPEHARIGRALTTLARRQRFEIVRFGVEAQGLCRRCQSRQRRQRKTR